MNEKKIEEIKENLENSKKKIKEEKKKAKKKIKENHKELENEFAKKGLMKRLLMVSFGPLVVMGVVLAIISSYQLIKSMEKDLFSELGAVVNMVDKMYDEIDDGDYIYEEGELRKGEYRITNNNSMIDAVKDKTNDDITVYYGDEVILTTIFGKNLDRISHEKARDEIVKEVLENGKIYKCSETLAGREYCSYYIPIKDNSGKVIGMMSASKERTGIVETIKNAIINVFVCMIVIFVLAACSIVTSTSRIIRKIKGVSSYLGNIKDGNLISSINQKSLNDKTEIGDMAESALKLNFALNDMVENIKVTVEKLSMASDNMKETAKITNATTEDVNKAIEEIASGTISQAEETQNATDNVMTMGEEIEGMSAAVKVLMGNADVMSESGENAHKMINDLSKANVKTIDAVEKIYHHTELTNDAVLKISKAASVITAIAEETNLLALNASIEAARAGENGKGFAVVASEIQSLAEQSNESADIIMKEIDELMAESELSVSVMKDVKKNVDMQSEKLKNTKNNFEVVINGIRKSSENIESIEKIMYALDENRKSIIDIIQSLSAISEENAAASEETSASTIQLAEIINKLADDAEELSGLAVKLSEDVSIFKTK